MKKIFLQKFFLWVLIFTASTMSLIFVQQQALSAWQAPGSNPGDNASISIPLTVGDNSNVDVADNNLINVADLKVDTLTATTSVNVLGTLTTDTFNANSLGVSDLTIPYGSGQGVVDITAINSSMQLTAANSAMGSATKAAYFMTGSSATGGASYGLYASTNALSAANPNYAVAGVSNNAGGTAVYGLANAGWAGYFSGPVGVAGSLAVGNNTSASGVYALAAGTNTEASGDNSFAAGDSSLASGSESFAFGLAAEATAGSSLAFGNEAVASGWGAVALGVNPIASGVQSVALGYYAQASAENAIALGPITVSGVNSLGINLDYASSPTFSQANSMAIMGGNVGINTLTPSSKLHLIGSYYQDGMMQVRPTTVLAASENIIYANLPSGSNATSNVILLQNNGSNRFRVTAAGVGSFASGVTATYANFSGALTVTGVTSLNGGGTAAGSFSMKTGGYMSFSGSGGSYFDFNDDSGLLAPSCAAGTSGVVYNFKVNNVLCYCNGTSWFSMVNGKADALCSDK